MLEVSSPLPVDGSTFAQIRHAFGPYCPGFSSSSGKDSNSGDTENMPLTRQKPFRFSNTTIMQYAPEAPVCTNNAKDWLAMVADREPRLMELLYLPADKDSRPLTWFAQSSFTSLSLDYSLSPPPSLSQRKDKGVRRKEALATVTLSLSAVLSPGRLHSHQSYLSALEAHGMSHYLAGDSHNTGSGVNLVSNIPGFTSHEGAASTPAVADSDIEGCRATTRTTISSTSEMPPKVTIDREIRASYGGRFEIVLSTAMRRE